MRLASAHVLEHDSSDLTCPASGPQVEKFLGKGSYGSVYRVNRVDDGQPYAVKETDVTKMSTQERQDAANEIRLLASVRHANIIRYFEAFLDGNWLCIIMEYAQSGDLAHYIKKGKERRTPFPEEVVWSFFIQTLKVWHCPHRPCVLALHVCICDNTSGGISL